MTVLKMLMSHFREFYAAHCDPYEQERLAAENAAKARELVAFAKTGGPVIVDDFYEHDYTLKDGVVKVIPLPWRSPHNRKEIAKLYHREADNLQLGHTIARVMLRVRPKRNMASTGPNKRKKFFRKYAHDGLLPPNWPRDEAYVKAYPYVKPRA